MPACIATSECEARACVSIVPPHPWASEEWYDEIQQPWLYDPDLGVMPAKPETGMGDGQYIYWYDSAVNRLKVVLNPHPDRVDRADELRRARSLAAFDRVVCAVSW